MGKIPGRPASPRPAGLAPPKTHPRLRTSDNVTQSRGSKSRVRPWINWKQRKASTSIQRFTRQPKITKIAETHFPGDYPRAEQGIGQVRGRYGPEGGQPTSPKLVGFAVVRPTGLGEVGWPHSGPYRPLTWRCLALLLGSLQGSGFLQSL